MRSSMVQVIIRKRALPVALAFCIAMLSAQAAFAWTHEMNSYPANTTCGYSQYSPCVY